MAKVSVVFGRWDERWPLMQPNPRASENIDSSTSSQASSNSATKADNCVEISTTGNIWVTLDGTTAAEGTHFLIPTGTTRTFPVMVGASVRVINA